MLELTIDERMIKVNDLLSIVPVLALIISALALIFTRKDKSDNGAQHNAYNQARTDITLENIANDIKEVKEDSKVTSRTIQQLVVDVAELKQSCKSAHHRIDKLEKNKGKDEEDE